MNDTFGLRKSDLKQIIAVIMKFDEVDYASVFGSRAKGNFIPGSDVDIVLIGKNLTQKTVTQVSGILNDECPLPYKFDVLNFKSITNNNLTGHINRNGKIFYTKNHRV